MSTRSRLLLLLACALGLLAPPAQGHRIRPAIVSVSFAADAGFRIDVQANFETWLSGIDAAVHDDTRDAPNAAVYDALRALEADALRERIRGFEQQLRQGLRVRFDGRPAELRLGEIEVPTVGDVKLSRVSTVSWHGTVPAGAAYFTWSMDPKLGDNVLKLRVEGDPDGVSHWLEDGATSPPFALSEKVVPRARSEVAVQYTALGFEHILPKGLDHILFVVGIFLLSLRLAPILWQVTAFTLAHTITLALSVYGVVSAPSSLVEPLIAASIVYVGVENLLTPQLKPWRVVVVFVFGLLHGMGFAGVLTEIGLPRGEFVTALIAFNVGVELGQLAVIALAFLAVGMWFRHRPWYRARIVIPASAAIALVGAWWTVERVLG